MGLLDEAIREHLDLKRRRGGDPAEIERAEREALGPVRRNRDPATAEAEQDATDEQLVGSAYDEPDESIAGDVAEQAPAFDEPDAAAVTGPPPPAFEFVDEDPPFADQPVVEEPEQPHHDDATATRVMRTADVPAPSDMTAEFDVEEALAAEAAEPAPEGEEDVLEETPEFLQDTPDHDRLWFEQRPPRDFDFDG